MRSPITGLVLLGLTWNVYAIETTLCQGLICYSMNVPATSTATTGPVFFQLSGPTSLAWMAMGAGSRMTNAKMFIIYQSANSQNVTLSPRSASGYETPSVDNGIKLSLLEGSGVSNGKMVANIRCDDCSTSQSAWVYAYLFGSMKSDSISVNINKHSNNGYMDMDIIAAKGGSSANPFGTHLLESTAGSACQINSNPSVNSNGTSSISGTSNATIVSGTSSSSIASPSSTEILGSIPEPLPGWWTGARPTPRSLGGIKVRRQSDEFVDCSGGRTVSSGGFIRYGASGGSDLERKSMAHGIMAGLAFAVLFPFGAISIRAFNFPGLVWFHAGLQIFTIVFFIAALALGVQLATTLGYMSRYHPVIGLVLLVLLVIQPILGLMHHRNFRASEQQTIWTYGHRWLGRLVITLGIINRGLGFLLAGNTTSGPIIYGIVAAVFYIAYLGSIFIRKRKRVEMEPVTPVGDKASLNTSSPSRDE